MEKPPCIEARGEDLQEALRATVPGQPGWVLCVPWYRCHPPRPGATVCASRSPHWLTPVPELLGIKLKPDVPQAESRTQLKEGLRQLQTQERGDQTSPEPA